MRAGFKARGPSRVRGRRLAVILVLLLAYAAIELWPRIAGRPDGGGSGDAAVEAAFDARVSGRVLEIEAEVERLLADDLEGSRHQRFIVRLESGRTLLVAHNIDLASRVPVEVGDRVEIRGQYEWNERGGVVHWTHHDPQGRRPGGWIRHGGEQWD